MKTTLSWCVLAVGLCAALSAAPPPAVMSEAQARPSLFPAQDLGLLESPDREEWQKPDLIMDILKIADGDRVADLGAGGGWFTSRLTGRVGANGVVYAQDIQPQMIEVIERRVERENLRNVRTVRGSATDPRLPPGLDAVLIVGAYHEMDDPEDPDVIVTLLRNVAKSLDAGGCLGVVDFLPGGGGPGPDPSERVAPEEVIGAATAAGLQLLSRQVIPPFVYVLVFGTPASRCAGSP
jgi:predicted methyltransferase